MGKKSRAKLEKKKRREREQRKLRNLRRALPATASDEDEIDLEAALEELPPEIQVERVMRRVALATGRRTFEGPQDAIAELKRRVEAGEPAREALAERDPRELAQDLAFLAMDPELEEDAPALIEQALELDPACVDARALRALQEPGDPVFALAAAADEALAALGGRERLAAHRGRSWDDVLARPYLRARRRLASVLWNQGRRAEAAPHLEELLELDAPDRVQAGDFLLGHDLERGELERARAGIERSERAGSPVAPWARALERWLSGDRREAAALVRKAGERSIAVIAELIEPGSFEVDEEDLGDEGPELEEALYVVDRIAGAWRAHEDAHRWLAEGARGTTALEREAACASFRPPVEALLGLGPIGDAAEGSEGDDGEGWLDYAAGHGLSEADVPELLRMASDPALDEIEGDDPRSWAPQHAWRALASLRAAGVVAPLLELAEARPEDDALLDDLPEVLARIGPAALEPLLAAFGDEVLARHRRLVACAGLARLAERDPSCRARTIEAFERELGGGSAGDPVFLGAIVGAALDLRAVELEPAIRAAYQAGRVEEEIAGRWKDVAHELRRGRG